MNLHLNAYHWILLALTSLMFIATLASEMKTKENQHFLGNTDYSSKKVNIGAWVFFIIYSLLIILSSWH